MVVGQEGVPCHKHQAIDFCLAEHDAVEGVVVRGPTLLIAEGGQGKYVALGYLQAPKASLLAPVQNLIGINKQLVGMRLMLYRQFP